MANINDIKVDSFSQLRLWYNFPICYEQEWERVIGIQDSAIIYLIEQDTIEKYKNRTTFEKELIFKRLVITLDSLKKCECSIVIE